MTTEEKLQNFYNHSLDSANREAERVIGDHQKALDKIFEEHKATARRQAEEEVAAETEKAKRDVNKTLSADQLHIMGAFMDGSSVSGRQAAPNFIQTGREDSSTAPSLLL